LPCGSWSRGYRRMKPPSATLAAAKRYHPRPGTTAEQVEKRAATQAEVAVGDMAKVIPSSGGGPVGETGIREKVPHVHHADVAQTVMLAIAPFTRPFTRKRDASALANTPQKENSHETSNFVQYGNTGWLFRGTQRRNRLASSGEEFNEFAIAQLNSAVVFYLDE